MNNRSCNRSRTTTGQGRSQNAVRDFDETSRPSTYFSDGSIGRIRQNYPVRYVRRISGGAYQLTRARGRDAENLNIYAATPRKRRQRPEHGGEAPSRGSRSARQQATPRNQPLKAHPRRSMGGVPNRSRSAKGIAPLPQQPSSSNTSSNATSPIQQSTAERGLGKKAACVATMVARLYNPALPENSFNFLVPNIFTRPEILNNCNGGNHIDSMIDALKRHTQNNL